MHRSTAAIKRLYCNGGYHAYNIHEAISSSTKAAGNREKASNKTYEFNEQPRVQLRKQARVTEAARLETKGII